MSLTDSGPHTVVVFLQEEITDHRGNIVQRPSSTGVTVRGCWMQPLAAARGADAAVDVEQGQRVSAACRLIARNAPVGWWSRVEWIDGLGQLRKFAPLGGPLPRDFSAGTTHITCTLSEMR